jgi:drug/metabolite transporter (DMT)-like permease
MSAARPPRAAYLAWLAICVIWGTTYLAIKVALEGIPPMLVGGIRYLIAGTALVIYLRGRGHRLPGPRSWPMFAVLGLLMLGIGNGGVVWAEQHVPSGLAAVVIATCPFWMVVVDAWFPGGEHMTSRHWIGLGIGFAGIVLLLWPDLVRGSQASRATLAGMTALQVACIGWSLGSSYGKRHTVDAPPLHGATLQMLAGGIWMTGAGTLMGEWAQFDPSPRAMLAVLYLAFIGGIVGFGAYIYALAHLPMAFVSLYCYINPIIAVALGTALLGEPFTPRMALAIAIILAGTAVVSLGTHRGSSSTSGRVRSEEPA